MPQTPSPSPVPISAESLPPRPDIPDPQPGLPFPQAPDPDSPNPDAPYPDETVPETPLPTVPPPDSPLPDVGPPDPDLPMPDMAEPGPPRAAAVSSTGPSESMNLARVIFDAMGDKQAEDIAILDLRPVTIMTDFFVIGTSGSPRQLKALIDAVEEQARVRLDRRPIGIDGELESGWVLLDYGDVMAHLMAADRRAYYRLEDIWQDAPLVARMA